MFFDEPELPFDSEPTGEQLRDEGIALLELVDDQWEAAAQAQLAELRRRGHPFTAADLVEVVGMPSHPNKVGAFIVGAAKRGEIRPTGQYVKARRAASHARVMREWQTTG